METTEKTPSQQQLEKVKSQAELKFLATKNEAISLSQTCTNITIVDTTTLAMANQSLSKANEHLKLAKLKGLEMRKPYNEATKLISEMEKQITDPLEKAIDSGKIKLRTWNESQEKIAKDKEAILQKENKFLLSIESELTKKGDACVTPQMCQDLMDSINKSPYFNKFDTYKQEAFDTKKRFLDLLQLKKVTLTQVTSGQPGGMVALSKMKHAEDIATEKSVEAIGNIALKQEEMSDSIRSNTTTSSVRKTWKYEVIEEDKLPKTWLMPDDKKIKEYLSINKASLTDGIIIDGVKFYIDKSPTIR